MTHAALTAAFAFALHERHAAAEDRADQCLRAYEGGQRSRNAGALRGAKSSFAYCASDACPNALHADCARWLDEVEAAVPTSVFHVSTSSGGELEGVSVSIDGGAEQALDGGAMSFDPGEHVVVFKREAYRTLERRFAFSEGEKLTPRNVSLEPLARGTDAPATDPLAADRSTPPTRRASLLPTWIAAGAGVVGTVGFAYFGSAARRDDRALDDCAPACSGARVDRVKSEYLLANVSLAVAATGFSVAAAWAIFRPHLAVSADRKESIVLELGPVTTLTRTF